MSTFDPDWWDLIPTVVGGLIASLVAYHLASRSSREVLKRDEIERVNADRAKAFRIFSIFTQIANSLLTFETLIAPMLNRMGDASYRYPIQRSVHAIVGVGNEKNFSFGADDLAIFLRKDYSDLITDFSLISARHSAICEGLQAYRLLKDDHAKILMGAAEHRISSDGSVESKVSKEVLPSLQLLEARLESVISPLIDMIRDTNDLVINVGERFNKAASDIFEPGTIPQIDFDDAKLALANALARK